VDLLKKEKLAIRDANQKNIDHLIDLCIPSDRKDDPLLAKV